MAESNIQWCTHVWNPVSGCTRVSAGCDNCYAAAMTHRLEGMGQKAKYGGLTVLNAKGDRHFNGQVRCHEDALTIPLKWKKPRRIFVNSMSDLFHKEVPFEFIDNVFAVMALCPQHTMQILSKRPERMVQYFESKPLARIAALIKSDSGSLWNEAQSLCNLLPKDSEAHLIWPLPNVWLGTSAEDQAAADERIPHLMQCPAAVRFLSLEPLISPVDLTKFMEGKDRTGRPLGKGDLIIIGGESGGGARPMHFAWARSILSQCRGAGVAAFFKQAGDYCLEHEDGFTSRGWPPGMTAKREGDFWRITGLARKGGDLDQLPLDLRVREFPRWPATRADDGCDLDASSREGACLF